MARTPLAAFFNRPTNKIYVTFLLGVEGVLSCAIFGIVPTTLGAITPIPSFDEPTSASRSETLPHEWSMKVWEGIGQVQVVQEDHRKVLWLETEQECMSLFRSLTVNLQANPVVSWEWSVCALFIAAASSQSMRDDHGVALDLVFHSGRSQAGKPCLDIFGTMLVWSGQSLGAPRIRQFIMWACAADRLS
jgi:DUF3047 family protein